MTLVRWHKHIKDFTCDHLAVLVSRGIEIPLKFNLYGLEIFNRLTVGYLKFEIETYRWVFEVWNWNFWMNFISHIQRFTDKIDLVKMFGESLP